VMTGASIGTGWAVWFCHICRWTGVLNAGEPHICNFKVSDTPRSGPEEISGHPATVGPHNNKEIA
jgi:hypothetical protein